MRLKQLREQLASLKKDEAIVQTREQVLKEDRERLLAEISALYIELRKLEIFPEQDLTPGNLSNVVIKLQEKIDAELSKLTIPSGLS